jgi:hypothetical protein
VNNEVCAPEGARERFGILKICLDDFDRQILQPADTVSARTNETAYSEAKAKELLSSVTAYEPGASCNGDCLNGMIPLLTFRVHWSILKKNRESKEACSSSLCYDDHWSSRWIYLKNADCLPAPMK